MPYQAKRECNHPGCHELATSGYCDKHTRPPQTYDDARESAAKRGYDRTWNKLRIMHLRRHPLCELCGSHKRLHVHHKTPISEGGAVLDPDNLQTLCSVCHNKVHKTGQRTAETFKTGGQTTGLWRNGEIETRMNREL